MRSEKPLHPGRFTRTTIIEPLGISVKDAAQALGIHRVALSRFLNEAAALSPNMALRIEKAFGVAMETLMHMQSIFDIAQTRKREGDIRVKPYTPTKASNPQQSID